MLRDDVESLGKARTKARPGARARARASRRLLGIPPQPLPGRAPLGGVVEAVCGGQGLRSRRPGGPGAPQEPLELALGRRRSEGRRPGGAGEHRRAERPGEEEEEEEGEEEGEGGPARGGGLRRPGGRVPSPFRPPFRPPPFCPLGWARGGAGSSSSSSSAGRQLPRRTVPFRRPHGGMWRGRDSWTKGGSLAGIWLGCDRSPDRGLAVSQRRM
jgi:hypothetical protein